MTSRLPCWCPKTMKRGPCWCPKPILWELNLCLMYWKLSFAPRNLHTSHLRDNALWQGAHWDKTNLDLTSFKMVISFVCLVPVQWQIQGRGPGPPPPPLLIFRANWGLQGGKKCFLRPGPPYLRVWMTAPPPPFPSPWALSEGLVPQGVSCSPAWRFCTTWITSCKGPIAGLPVTSRQPWAFLSPGN